jgi:CubicO group peptidase (beta-lactamase class C family)
MSEQGVGVMSGQIHVDQSRLNSAVEWAFTEPDPQHPRRTRAVVILQNGRIIAERYVEGFNKDTPLIGWSMTKSATNALVGILVRTGKLSLDEPVPLPEWQKPGDAKKKITLNHLLHMSSGLQFGEDSYGPWDDVTYMLLRVSDMAAFAAKKKLAAEPGTKWYYSSGNTNIICRIVRRVVGEADYISFPRRELFEPIGMSGAVIELDASGTFVGSSFMYATARDWARFGQLYLHDGIWAGRRILPEGWVKYTTTPAPASANKEYGAHFWLKIPKEYRSNKGKDGLPGDAFHAVGHEGQFLTIIPSRSLVVVRLGLTRLPHVWQQDEFINMILDAVKG